MVLMRRDAMRRSQYPAHNTQYGASQPMLKGQYTRQSQLLQAKFGDQDLCIHAKGKTPILNIKKEACFSPEVPSATATGSTLTPLSKSALALSTDRPKDRWKAAAATAALYPFSSSPDILVVVGARCASSNAPVALRVLFLSASPSVALLLLLHLALLAYLLALLASPCAPSPFLSLSFALWLCLFDSRLSITRFVQYPFDSSCCC
jgi:hypothetical protein